MIIWRNSTISLANNIIAKNHSSFFAGAMLIFQWVVGMPVVTMINNTICYNTADQGAEGISWNVAVKMLNNIVVQDSLVLLAGQFDVNGKGLRLNAMTLACSGGTITKNGGYFDLMGTINLTYTVPCTTGDELIPTNIEYLTVDVGSGNSVVMASNTSIWHGVNLTSGNINTMSDTLDLGSSGSLTGEATNRYVIGNLSVSRVVGTGASTMGGTGIGLDAGAGNDMGTVTVIRVSGSSGNVMVDGKTGINRKWIMTSEHQIPGGRNLTLSWVTNDNASLDLTTAQVWSSNNGGSSWSPVGTAQDIRLSSPPTITTLVSSDLPISSILTVSDGANPLPVEMTGFTATPDHRSAHLSWSTATEVNCYGFEIERRAAASDWIRIAFISGAGTSNVPHTYTYADDVGRAGKYEYRIKQIDKSGGYKYTPAVELELVDTPEEFSVRQNYPNPFNPSTTIRLDIPQRSRVRLAVFNILGQQVEELANEEMNAGSFERIWNADVASGLYFYRLEAVSVSDPNKRFVDVKKMIVLK